MTTRPEITWRGGLWGAIAGVVLGLILLLALPMMRESAPASAAPAPSAAPAGEAGADGVRTMADGEAGLGIPDAVSTRGRALMFLLAAHLANDDYDRAVAVADEMEPGIDRDAGLQEISEKVVSRDLTTNPTMIPRGGPDVRAAMNVRLRRLLQLADRATGPDLRARLLVRTAVVKRSFNKENHVATAPDEADLDPDALLVKVDGLAKQVPPRREGSGWGVGLKILLTALLGMLGFAVSQVFEPVLKASGALVAADLARRLHSDSLADQLVRSNHEAAGEPPPKPEHNPVL